MLGTERKVDLQRKFVGKILTSVYRHTAHIYICIDQSSYKYVQTLNSDYFLTLGFQFTLVSFYCLPHVSLLVFFHGQTLNI